MLVLSCLPKYYLSKDNGFRLCCSHNLVRQLYYMIRAFVKQERYFVCICLYHLACGGTEQRFKVLTAPRYGRIQNLLVTVLVMSLFSVHIKLATNLLPFFPLEVNIIG